MIKNIILYAIALVILIIFDAAWLGVIAKSFYGKHLGYIIAKNIAWWAVALFYPLFVFGLTVFVLLPNINGASYLKVFILGALFGLIAYSTYNLTNAATIKDWPIIITPIDVLWGSFVGGATSLFAIIIYRKFM